MTVRSVLLGLVGAAAICAVVYLNDRLLQGTYLIGNHLPVSVYGTLILFTLAVNPLLRRLALTGREIAVILVLVLAACTIPSSGLLRTFTDALIMPWHQERVEPGWREGPAAIREQDVLDWPGLLSALRESKEDSGRSGLVWERLSPDLRRRVVGSTSRTRLRRIHARADDTDLRGDLRSALNALLDDEALWLSFGALKSAGDGAPRTQTEVRALGRLTLHELFPRCIAPQKPAILDLVPERMLADVGEDTDRRLVGFVRGLGEPNRHISVSEVPWSAWTRTFLFWIPIIVTFWLALLGVAVVVHRQWAEHERLPYPLASFANSLVPAGGKLRSVIFGKRLFWMGLGAVLLIHVNNYSYLWLPNYLVRIPTRVDLSGLGRILPYWRHLLRPTMFFIVIGIAYFVPKDISLSFGLGPYLWGLVTWTLGAYGVSMGGTLEGASWWLGLRPLTFTVFGACLGVFLTMLYTGRHHYRTVLCRALGLKSGLQAEAAEAWGCRLFMVCVALLAAQIAVGTGVGIVTALLFVSIAVLCFVVAGRVMAESGLFHLQINVFPCVILWGLFGARAIGVRTLLTMQVLSMVLLIDPRESLIPYLANGFKLLDLQRVSKAHFQRLWMLVGLALLVGLLVGLPVTLYLQYDHGLTHDVWAERMVPEMPFNNAVAVRDRLAAQGLTEGDTDETGSWLARLKANRFCVTAMGVSLALVLVFAAARLRFSWWPLHPLMFVVWATNHAGAFGAAFLVGWLIKRAVAKYGGNQEYERLKPLMYGLIAGEVLGALVPCVYGLLYYLTTGKVPIPFRVLPG